MSIWRGCLLIVYLAFSPGSPLAAEKQNLSLDFVGSEACKNCHQTEYALWADSHHARAWREATPENVQGDFNARSFERAGFTYRLQKKGSNFFVVADAADGKPTRYRVESVVGVTPLQQYLVDTGAGHLQALDIAWDTEHRRWFDLYPDQDTSPGNGMHWSGSYKNWNSRCAECHATDFHKNYDPTLNRYASTQAELGVGCEACHGPGSAHLAWAARPVEFDQKTWRGVTSRGLVERAQIQGASAELNLCAPCHSRREPLGADSPPAGSPFDDHYRLAWLRSGLYYPDGQIRDEVYVLGSFLQSKMHGKGVRCSNCHDPHSYRLRLGGNRLCTQCHSLKGNPAFPSLEPADYDSVSHHFHAPGSAGAACKNCHMPERFYMVVDGRRDHSFRIPRPDLSLRLMTPDPCTKCHSDKSPAWSMRQIESRFPDAFSGRRITAETFAAADQQINADTAAELAGMASDSHLPAILRASAAQRLAGAGDPDWADRLQALLSDPSAVVRQAAIALQRSATSVDRVKRLAPALGDPMQSVRIEAAKALLGIPPENIPVTARYPLRSAMEEFQHSLYAKADFPESQMVIGGVALTLRNLTAARSAFERAVEMDPQLIQAWFMLARIEMVTGERGSVRKILQKGLQANPSNDMLKRTLRDLEALSGQ